uniref:Uncharacterized protein n=1 Tax=Rhizophora mucronata TaxID=61149 RepID=A0A2P2Q9K7_RHIMU
MICMFPFYFRWQGEVFCFVCGPELVIECQIR